MDWFREKYKETIVLPVNHGGFLQIPDFTFKSLLCRIDGKFCFSRKWNTAALQSAKQCKINGIEKNIKPFLFPNQGHIQLIVGLIVVNSMTRQSLNKASAKIPTNPIHSTFVPIWVADSTIILRKSHIEATWQCVKTVYLWWTSK